MNVLLVNPRCPETYWSAGKVLRMTGKKILEPPLGLLTLAALLPQAWDFKFVELIDRPITEREWHWCHMVMVTGMGVQLPGILEIIREGRRKGKFVVVGGPAVFHVPQDALDAGADIVVRGEAEPALPELFKSIEQKQSGVIIEAPGWADLTNTPVPRYDLLELDIYANMEVQFSRGCPYRCEFCDITLMLGRKVRTKSPRQILLELQRLYNLGWRRGVMFVDDNFIGNPSKAKELLRKVIPWMEERDHPFEFETQASVNLAEDPELLELMVRAGFVRVFLGIETPDEDSLRLSRKQQNLVKNLDSICRTINEAGLQIMAGCIVGFDQERPGADRRLIDFAIRNQIPQMFISLLQVGPGTDLWHRLEAENRLLWTGFDENLGSNTGLINFVPTRPVEEIVSEYIHLYDTLYEPESYLERTYGHFLRMKPSPVKRRFSLPYSWELRAVLIMLYKQGVCYSSRWKFWKYFFKALFRLQRKRFELFLATCVLGEHYFEFRNVVKKELLNAMARKRCSLF